MCRVFRFFVVSHVHIPLRVVLKIEFTISDAVVVVAILDAVHLMVVFLV